MGRHPDLRPHPCPGQAARHQVASSGILVRRGCREAVLGPIALERSSRRRVGSEPPGAHSSNVDYRSPIPPYLLVQNVPESQGSTSLSLVVSQGPREGSRSRLRAGPGSLLAVSQPAAGTCRSPRETRTHEDEGCNYRWIDFLPPRCIQAKSFETSSWVPTAKRTLPDLF